MKLKTIFTVITLFLTFFSLILIHQIHFVNLSDINESTAKFSDLERDDSYQKVTSQLVSHDPIEINGNLDFISQGQNEGWQGNGSLSNPVIIQNYFINTGGSYGINVSNVDLFFEIKNLSVNISDALLSNTVGITLNNVSNGKYTGNYINNSYVGFQSFYLGHRAE